MRFEEFFDPTEDKFARWSAERLTAFFRAASEDTIDNLDNGVKLLLRKLDQSVQKVLPRTSRAKREELLGEMEEHAQVLGLWVILAVMAEGEAQTAAALDEMRANSMGTTWNPTMAEFLKRVVDIEE